MTIPKVNLGNGDVLNLDSLGVGASDQTFCPGIKDDGTVGYDQTFKMESLTSNTSGFSVGGCDFLTLSYVIDAWSLLVKPFVKDGTPITGPNIDGSGTVDIGVG